MLKQVRKKRFIANWEWNAAIRHHFLPFAFIKKYFWCKIRNLRQKLCQVRCSEQIFSLTGKVYTHKTMDLYENYENNLSISSGFWAAAPKGQCPVGHGGEFPYILRGHIWGLWGNFPWYSMGVLLIFNFSSICHVIQWEFHIFFHFSSISNVIQWEVCILSISHVIQ